VTCLAGNPTFLPPSQPARSSRSEPKSWPPQHGADLSNLKPGTTWIESGTTVDQGPMGLYGVLVVTTAGGRPTSPGCAYPGAAATWRLSYDAGPGAVE